MFSRRTSASLTFGWLGGGAERVWCCTLCQWYRTHFFCFPATRPHLFFREEGGTEVRKVRTVNIARMRSVQFRFHSTRTFVPTLALLRETPCVLCPYTQTPFPWKTPQPTTAGLQQGHAPEVVMDSGDMVSQMQVGVSAHCLVCCLDHWPHARP